ncbi:MAG: RNA 2',3'-cyclic phosphodiesterase [Acidobacteriaceae bacterium]|nr:RNA 2',3'-cyclic phosphodiesterase [Acidobacteriaceae bacterium]
MRLFTGIDLPESILERLERLLVHFRATAHLKWSPVYNLHITTKFIGEWPEEKLEVLKQAFTGIPHLQPVPISVEGFGWFPNPHRPNVFFVGVHGGEPLKTLFDATEIVLEPLGIAKEKRPFSPHLTLARIKEPTPLEGIRQAIAHSESTAFGSFEAREFHLYLSKPGAAGSVYTKLSTFPFS